jgi:hypothetical protein
MKRGLSFREMLRKCHSEPCKGEESPRKRNHQAHFAGDPSLPWVVQDDVKILHVDTLYSKPGRGFGSRLYDAAIRVLSINKTASLLEFAQPLWRLQGFIPAQIEFFQVLQSLQAGGQFS